MIEIDPNVRIANDNTWTYVPSDEIYAYRGSFSYVTGDAIAVWEPETQIQWPATILKIEKQIEGDYYLELDVAWEKGTYIGK